MLHRTFVNADVVSEGDPPPGPTDARWQYLSTAYAGGGATLVIPRGQDDRSDPTAYPYASLQLFLECQVDGVRQVHVIGGSGAYGGGETGHHGHSYNTVPLSFFDAGTDLRVAVRAAHPLMTSTPKDIEVEFFLSVIKLPEETE